MSMAKSVLLNSQKLVVLLAVVWGCSVSLHATTYNLTPSGDLQGTLNGSHSGDVINLAPGTYTMKTGEPWFHVDNSITLQGTGGSAQTTIQAPTSAPLGLEIRNSNTTVKGVKIIGGPTGVSIGYPGVSATGVTLFDVVVNPSTGSPGHGISVGVSGATIDTCNIGPAQTNGIYVASGSNNLIIRNSSVQSAITGEGIVVQSSSGAQISNTTVGTASKDGILLQLAPNATISGVSITGNVGQHGIFIQDSNTVSVSNTSVSNASQIGIVAQPATLSAVTGISLTAVTITAAGQQGILLDRASNSTVDTATIGTVGQHGVYVLDSDFATVRNSTVANASANGITVQASRNPTVNSPVLYKNTVTVALLQGILFSGVTHGTIDSCTITHAAGTGGNSDGIYLDAGSTNNLVINNTVARAETHGLVNKLSTFNTWAGNTVSSTGFHGMELIGSSYNRVEWNALSGFLSDGITVTIGDDNATLSLSNYIGKNTVTSNGRSAGRSSGTGIWLNAKSNNTFVFGNNESGDVEGGITSFNSSNSYLRANQISGNGQAGLLMWNQDPSLGNLQYSIIQNNYIANNPSPGLILLRGAKVSDIGYNFLVGTGAATPGADPGITLNTWTGAGQTGASSGPSSNATVYRTTFWNDHSPISVGSDVTKSLIFENRFVNPSNLPVDVYSYAGAGVNWHNQLFMGGNYWGAYLTAPYTNFIIDAAGDRGGGFIDRFPLPNEAFGLAYAIAIQEPAAGVVAAVGSQKTISWKSAGCFLVDLSYNSSSTGASGAIASGYPDYGFYQWTVPAVAAAADYTITVSCKDSTNAGLSTTSTTAPFTIGSAGLLLLSPGRDLMVNSDQPVRVSWARTGGFSAGVNVSTRTAAGGAWTAVANNVTGDSVDIPVTGLNSNRVSVLIQSATGGNIQDSVDGFFTVRGGTPVFTNPGGTGPVSFAMKTAVDVEWISPKSSYLVTLDLWDAEAGQFTNIVTNLPDYGKYTWLVPELWMSGGYIRATFMDASGNVLGTTTNSVSLNLRYTTTPGTLEPFYRLYSSTTLEHLYTTDSYEYAVLGTRGWSQEGEIGQVLNGPKNIAGTDATPYYRLYNPSIFQHLWTTDRNEYFSLRQSTTYNPEGPIGYVFRSSMTGSTPLYRLVYVYPPYYHLWTIDANENSVLPTRGWSSEGVAAYIFCAPGNLTYSGCATTLSAAPGSPAVPAISGPVAFSLAPAVALNLQGSGVKPVLDAVLNGASFESGPVAPGETISLFGAGLGPAEAAVQEFRSDTAVGRNLAGAQVWMDGEEVPLLYASAAELKAIVPHAISDKKSVEFQVEYRGNRSAAIKMKTGPTAPGIFTADGSGKGQAAALNEDNTPNSAENPASRGSVVAVYATGQGLTDPVLADDALPSPDNQYRPVLPVSAVIDGRPAEILYAGAAPGLPGAFQVNLRVPADATPGSAIPVAITVGLGTSQKAVTLALK
jgi:uncharacterized protein (TIGR03437 family)